MAAPDKKWPDYSAYWTEREKDAAQNQIKDEKTYNQQAWDILNLEQMEIVKEINAFYQKYADEHGLSLADVKQKADHLDIQYYQQLAKQYTATHDVSEAANADMGIYNLTMKTSRLKALWANIELLMLKYGNQQVDLTRKAKLEAAEKEYQRQAGIMGTDNSSIPFDLEQIINGSYQNTTFSSHIWKHQAQLRDKLRVILRNGLIQGRNPREFIPMLTRAFKVTHSQAETLIRTEMARARVQAEVDSYQKNGFNEVVFIDCEDADVCAHCESLDGHHWKISELAVGVNQPPIHPNCRCSLGIYQDLTDFEKYLQDPVAVNMTYEQWLNFEKNYPANPLLALRVLTSLSSQQLSKVDITKYFGQSQLKFMLSHALPGSFLSKAITLENGKYRLDPDSVPQKDSVLKGAKAAYAAALWGDIKSKASQLAGYTPKQLKLIDLNDEFTPDELAQIGQILDDTNFQNGKITTQNGMKKKILLEKLIQYELPDETTSDELENIQAILDKYKGMTGKELKSIDPGNLFSPEQVRLMESLTKGSVYENDFKNGSLSISSVIDKNLFFHNLPDDLPKLYQKYKSARPSTSTPKAFNIPDSTRTSLLKTLNSLYVEPSLEQEDFSHLNYIFGSEKTEIIGHYLNGTHSWNGNGIDGDLTLDEKKGILEKLIKDLGGVPKATQPDEQPIKGKPPEKPNYLTLSQLKSNLLKGTTALDKTGLELLQNPDYQEIFHARNAYFENGKNSLWDFKAFENSLTPQQRQAITDYMGNDYEPMNAQLRGLMDKDPDTQEQIKEVKDALKNVPALKTNIIVYRGMPAAVIKDKYGPEALLNPESMIGQTVKDAAFTSTSLSVGVATGFGTLNSPIFEYYLPKGSKPGAYITPLIPDSDEYEFLLKPGLSFKVVSVGKHFQHPVYRLELVK